MKPPVFKLPYDSPIEEVFARYAVKYFDESIDLKTQVEIDTICGLFRVDFTATTLDGVVTVFEADGKEFHNEHRDEWRDAMVMRADNIDEIYRIRGSDIIYRLDDIFYMLSIWSPQLFSERNILNLSLLAPDELKKRIINESNDVFTASFSLDGIDELQQVRIEKRHKDISKEKRQFWQTAFKYAVEQGGGDLDEIIKSYCK